MKKTIAILLVAVLAAGSLFAGLSGEASVTAGVDLDTKEWGFLGNGTNVKFDLSLGKEDVENVAEGEVYASIKASLEAKIANNPYTGEAKVIVQDKNDEKNGYNVPVRVIAKVTEAKIFGSNWYVSILGVPNAPDFAKSAIETYVDKTGGVDKDDWGFIYKDNVEKPVSYKVDYDKAPGVEAGYADYVVGVGLKGTKDGKAYTAYAQTPEYEFDAVKAQFAAVASKKAGTSVNNIGASAKASYATDVLSTSVAADLGLAVAKESKFAMDLAANFKYDFVTVDAYLNTAKATEAKDGTYFPTKKTDLGKVSTPLHLSAKVATDLNAFDVPVKLELTGKDLLAKIDLGAKVTVNAIENLELTVSGGYVVNTVGRNAEALWFAKEADIKPFAGQWSANVGAKYTASFATISGEVSLKNWGLNDLVNTQFDLLDPEKAVATQKLLDDYAEKYDTASASTQEEAYNILSKRLVLGAKVSVENTTLIPGATLKLAWEGKDLTNKVKIAQKGTVAASCTIKF